MITAQFILAVEKANKALREQVCRLQRTTEAEQDGTIGNLIRTAIEDDLQTADLLDGWVTRAKKEIGMKSIPE